jgi:DnaJ-class molecular chaperone
MNMDRRVSRCASPIIAGNKKAEHDAPVRKFERSTLEDSMRKNTEQKKQKCKNCEGKGTLKKGDKIVRCQRCGGTGIKP